MVGPLNAQLVLLLLWLYLWFGFFSLDFLLSLIKLVKFIEDPGVHVEGKAKHGNYSLVWSWSVPKGVTFCIPSHGGRARSPLSTMPCKWLVVTFNFQEVFRCSLAHLHLVDGAPVLGVLDLGVGRVDDLVVVVKQLLADWALGVEVLRIRKILIFQLQLCAQMKIC